MEFEIRPATGNDVAMAAALLARAFADDPAMVWLLPSARTRERRLTRMFSVLLRHIYLPLNSVDLAVRGGKTYAVAAWAPPGQWKPPLRRIAAAAPMMLRALGPRMRTGEEMLDALENHHPARPHWYLATVATEPVLRGRGAAKALLTPRLERCDRNGMPAYTETANEAFLPFLGHLGFARLHLVEIPGGAPEQIGLWREPVTKGRAPDAV